MIWWIAALTWIVSMAAGLYLDRLDRQAPARTRRDEPPAPITRDEQQEERKGRRRQRRSSPSQSQLDVAVAWFTAQLRSLATDSAKPKRKRRRKSRY